LPNFNYIPEINALKQDGKLNEVLDLARYVTGNSDMPGQIEAAEIEKETEAELASKWLTAKKSRKGLLLVKATLRVR
jgi:hypothetical protein